jgi:hypothetical protein
MQVEKLFTSFDHASSSSRLFHPSNFTLFFRTSLWMEKAIKAEVRRENIKNRINFHLTKFLTVTLFSPLLVVIILMLNCGEVEKEKKVKVPLSLSLLA